MVVGVCIVCKQELDKSAFSGPQWKNGQARRRCIRCVSDAEASALSQAPTQATAPCSSALPCSSEQFSVGSPGPSIEAPKKRGRPAKASEDKAVRVKAWKCWIDGMDADGYAALRDKARELRVTKGCGAELGL